MARPLSTRRTWLIGLATAGTLTGLLTGAVGIPAAATDSPEAALATALDTTRAAGRLHFRATVTVGDATVTARGATDLPGQRTAVNVTIGDDGTEIRRIGASIYMDVARLGATGTRWVALGPADGARQLAVRSVSGLVDAVSPQRLLTAIGRATDVVRVGPDDYGMQYRVRTATTWVDLIPLIDVFGSRPPDTGAGARMNVWLDARGRLTQITVVGTGYRLRLTLSGLGAPVDIAAPPPAATSGLRSESGRDVFGAGSTLRPLPPASPAITSDPSGTMVDGVVLGALNARSARRQQLIFEPVAGSNGGKIAMGTVEIGGALLPDSFTLLPYATWLDDGGSKGAEDFSVRVREETRTQRYLARIPLIGRLTTPVIRLIQDTPSVSELLGSVVGVTTSVRLDLAVNAIAPGDTPIAFTRMVPGHRGTPISMNFFPASGLAAGETAPVILQGSALGQPGNVDHSQTFDFATFTPGTATLREQGYNVITWDPRGEFASGGIMQLDNPFYDARDVSALISWAAAESPTTLNGPGDPAMGVIGGSSSGAVALMTASIDPRVDAIVPALAYNSLVDSLQPNGVLNGEALTELLTAIDRPGIRMNGQLRRGLEAALATGRLDAETLALLAPMDVDALLGQLQAPTLLWQSTADPIVPLGQAAANAQRILSNPYGTYVKIGWVDARSRDTAVTTAVSTQALQWFDKFVKGAPIPIEFLVPQFQWWDQTGTRRTSSLLPFEAGFNAPEPFSATSAGGVLAIGAGSTTGRSRITVPLTVPVGALIAGAPSLTFTYRGTGTSRSIYAVVTESATAGAPQNNPTPIPVTLDGTERTVSVPMRDIAYTGSADGALRVVLRGSIPGWAPPGTGTATITNVTVSLPQVATG